MVRKCSACVHSACWEVSCMHRDGRGLCRLHDENWWEFCVHNDAVIHIFDCWRPSRRSGSWYVVRVLFVISGNVCYRQRGRMVTINKDQICIFFKMKLVRHKYCRCIERYWRDCINSDEFIYKMRWYYCCLLSSCKIYSFIDDVFLSPRVYTLVIFFYNRSKRPFLKYNACAWIMD